MRKRFVVDLGNVELSEKAIQNVESQIQKAALTAIAEVDYRGDLVAHFPKEWLGIWINVAKDLQVPQEEFIAFAGR